MKEYRQCIHCVLDTNDDPNIRFDQLGVCNYCRHYEEQSKLVLFPADIAKKKLQNLIADISASGKNKKYDCIMGVSGGVDSTYLAWRAKEWGLRPLLVHLDNGWNSELSVENIENLISKTGFDLFTYVIDWEEFRDIQLSFFKANVVDIELVSDHAIFTCLYDLAAKHNIKFMLSGRNFVTEEILPKHWIHNKSDSQNIISIHQEFGTQPFKTYPLLTPLKKIRYFLFQGLTSVNPLDLIEYRKKEVKETIIRELGWRDYGGKHYESVFTRFYQGYILPNKFGIDKRRAHVSNLICSGQLTRTEALAELEKPIYDPAVLDSDYDFVLKKLGFTKEAFEQYLRQPRREHDEFKVEQNILQTYPLLRYLQKLKRLFIKK